MTKLQQYWGIRRTENVETINSNNSDIDLAGKVTFAGFTNRAGLISGMDQTKILADIQRLASGREQKKEQKDETNPDDYEDKASNIDYIEETPDLKEVTTDEEEFRNWEGIEEDWQEFNRKNNPENDVRSKQEYTWKNRLKNSIKLKLNWMIIQDRENM